MLSLHLVNSELDVVHVLNFLLAFHKSSDAGRVSHIHLSFLLVGLGQLFFSLILTLFRDFFVIKNVLRLLPFDQRANFAVQELFQLILVSFTISHMLDDSCLMFPLKFFIVTLFHVYGFFKLLI